MMYAQFTIILILTTLLYTYLNIEAKGISGKALEDTSSDNNVFPKDFLFGVSTSAPQTEGAWNVSDRGPSVWDVMIHADPSLQQDRSNFDVATDFYHKYKEDIRLAKSVGAQMFKLSFSWSRILPSGFTNHISKDGIQFYKNVLNEIAANEMIPMVALFQMDLPYDLQKMGGLSNPLFIDWFEQYARLVFATFGDKVKHWTTISDLNLLCYCGYGNSYIPQVNLSGIADYLCGHHVLLAHTRVYHLYDREFRPKQNGEVGYTIYYQVPQPGDPSSDSDVAIAEVDHQRFNNWLVHPIFSSTGDYPPIMKEIVAIHSRIQGFSTSRLPRFTEEQIRNMRGASDFLGIHYYTYELVTPMSDVDIHVVNYDNDFGVAYAEEPSFRDAPSMLGKLIQRLNQDYHPTIYITENGFSESALEDKAKVAYFRGHLAEVLKAIRNGVDIRGYLLWSLMDSVELYFGTQLQFGLFHVDFNHPNLTRTPRLSSKFIARVYETRRLDSAA
ncbi:PREDICTED: myrosinase 1-like [Dinoponera quadriceps]|uniref:beta-glucosidase n=1 Tax=Dinoponera quadriceps TaxID=609295 RepID=A0A6P3Y831_DINQU|nr:PREDICTED: myrosinase 1-like [Dinoponera quadriceps]